jgi:hypothetical protein
MRDTFNESALLCNPYYPQIISYQLSALKILQNTEVSMERRYEPIHSLLITELGIPSLETDSHLAQQEAHYDHQLSLIHIFNKVNHKTHVHLGCCVASNSSNSPVC